MPLTFIAIVDHEERASSLVAVALFVLVGAVVVAVLWVASPQRIEITDKGLRAVSVLRTKEFQWSDLQTVSSPWYDYANATVVWRSSTGKVVTGRNYIGFLPARVGDPIEGATG